MKITKNHFNPTSKQFKESFDDFKDLSTGRQLTAVIAAIAGAILTPFILFTGGIASFQLAVKWLKPGDNAQTDQTQKIVNSSNISSSSSKKNTTVISKNSNQSESSDSESLESSTDSVTSSSTSFHSSIQENISPTSSTIIQQISNFFEPKIEYIKYKELFPKKVLLFFDDLFGIGAVTKDRIPFIKENFITENILLAKMKKCSIALTYVDDHLVFAIKVLPSGEITAGDKLLEMKANAEYRSSEYIFVKETLFVGIEENSKRTVLESIFYIPVSDDLIRCISLGTEAPVFSVYEYKSMIDKNGNLVTNENTIREFERLRTLIHKGEAFDMRGFKFKIVNHEKTLKTIAPEGFHSESQILKDAKRKLASATKTD